MATYLLIDGNSLTYRAFFAVPADMATASGQVTNAVFGFTSMLVNLVKDHRPDGIMVAFDRPEPTFRHDVYDEYKAGRDETPDVLIEQFGIVRDLLERLEVTTLDVVGYEADDILATIATRLRDAGDDAIVVTGDRDVFQLVEDPHIKVLYNKRGVSDYMLYDEAGIRERTGVMPSQYVDYAAMRGDPSDNMPGIPGIGEKTAAKLLNQYQNLDGVIAHRDEQTPKLRANLTEFESVARRNVELMPLVRDVPIDVVDMGLQQFDAHRAHEFFELLEFRTLWQRILQVWPKMMTAVASNENSSQTQTEIVSVSRVQSVAEVLVREEPLVLFLQTGAQPTERNALVPITRVYCVTSDKAVVAIEKPTPQQLFELCHAPRGFVSSQTKLLQRTLLADGRNAADPYLDITIGAYLLNPASGAQSAHDLAGIGEVTDKTVAQQGSFAFEDATNGDGPADDAVMQRDAQLTVSLAKAAHRIEQKLRDQNMWELWESIERPLIGVLARMEHLGIAIDRPYLQSLADRLADEVKRCEVRVHELAGEVFNVNSTQQLRRILFEKLHLTPQKKTKTGYSTNAASLERLRGEHEIIDVLLKYREVEKLRSTYGEALIHEIASDGRIHATFQQTVARTGRLSSDRPNLHNIPVRSEEGRAFRQAFVAVRGHTLLVADYNQIELRVIAHLSKDPGLLSAFREGHDIHTETAARVFGVAPTSVTRDQRSKSKMISYGLAYGMEAYGLSQRLNIEVAEANAILQAYFNAFPYVREYMDTTVANARKNGYTETLFGRRRPIPELLSPNYQLRQSGERQAMNAGIQGLAADIFKIALVRLDLALATTRSNIVLQVHDEILVEAHDDELEFASTALVDAMQSAMELAVPLEVNVSQGRTWAEAKN